MSEPIVIKKIEVDRNICRGTIDIYVKGSVVSGNGPTKYLSDDGQWKDFEPYAKPMLSLSYNRDGCEVAQMLADGLWDARIRPAGARGSAGQLTAVQYHLEDMRKIAFGLLKEDKEK